MFLPKVKTVDEYCNIIDAVVLTKISGAKYLKPITELNPNSFGENTDITMALWRYDESLIEHSDNIEYFDCSTLHKIQQEKLKEFILR